MTRDRMDDMDDTHDRPDDGRLDDALLEAARAYNAPPAPPREAMWERIRAARAAAAPRAATPPAPTSTGDVQWYGARRLRRRPAWAMPLAAALLLAVGITVGRMSAGRTKPSRAPVAAAPTPAGGSAPSVETPSTAPSADVRVATDAPGGTTPPGERAASRVHPPGFGGHPPAPIGVAYRLAAAEHLALTETLLTTVRDDARAGRADSSVAAWARDLLGTTRVLLDSPAGRDPRLARLLEDLELVLAQVAQLPAAGSAAATEELRAIDRAARRRDVLTRVRAAATPAGS